jgi:hypothetical protein
LIVDFDFLDIASKPSVLNISGNGLVDVQAGGFRLGPMGTLNITDNGKLIWRNKSLADLNGTIVLPGFPEGSNEPRPVLAEGSILNARAIQVGPDVHFVRVPEPNGIWLATLGVLAATVDMRRRGR